MMTPGVVLAGILTRAEEHIMVYVKAIQTPRSIPGSVQYYSIVAGGSHNIIDTGWLPWI